MTYGVRRLFTALIVSAALTGPSGCAVDDDARFPAPTPGTDGALPPRVLSDAAVGAGNPGDAPASGDAPGAPDAGGDAAPVNPTLEIKVSVDEPKASALVVVRDEFAPNVTVVTDTTTPSAGDLITSVSAWLRPISGPGASTSQTRLNQVGLQTVPGSNLVTYRFAKTPLDLSTLASGPHELVVTAKSSGGAEGTATVAVVIDAGPTIRVNEPIEGTAYTGSADVNLTVGDGTFPVIKVVAAIGQREIPLTGPSPLGLYTGKIDFASFEPPLVGDQLLTVRATNQNQTESVVVRKFVSDNVGPTISNTKPTNGDIVGRVVEIAAEISDPRGVNDSTVKVVIAHGDQSWEFPLVPPAPGSMAPVYTYLFDTSKLPINALFPSITFRAKDKLGNESVVGYLVSLDNMPPLADIDPPSDFRVLFRTAASSPWLCTWPFDPVGPDTVDDGDVVAQLFDVRARVEDQGNEPRSGGADFTPISTVASADLLILDDVSKPLVVDSKRRIDGPVGEQGARTDLDGYCDELNPSLKVSADPSSSPDVLVITMAPIAPQGLGDGTPDPSLPSGGICERGDQSTAPISVCDTTSTSRKPGRNGWPMTLFLNYANAKLPSLWGVPPVVNDKVQCAGRQFDALANKVRDGWACLVVRAKDKLGNEQLSRVLRVCVDHDGQGNECPHRKIAAVVSTTPLTVTTLGPHGLMTGDEVIVGGVYERSAASRFIAQVVDETTVALTGAGNGVPLVGASIVAAKALPSCTGTVTAVGPPAAVDASRSCKPWRLFPREEYRNLQ